jgi:hypothetical protein
MQKGLFRYVQIEYVSFAEQERGQPWVVVVAETTNPDGRVVIYEDEHCWHLVNGEDRKYLEALLADWRETVNQSSDALLDSLSGLFIGPIRTHRTGYCTHEELDIMLSKLKEKTG